MKKFLLVFLMACITNLGLQAQVWQVTEDLTAVICETSLTGGIPADTLYICQAPTNGSLVITNDTCASYTPNPNYFGYDQICLTTCIAGVCTDSIIQITINPVGESIYQNTPEDATYFVCENVISGGSNVVIAGCSLPLYGTANYNPSCVIYIPPTNYVGTDSFCIVSCIDTLCDTSTLVMNMTPVTESITATVTGNGSITICYADLLTIVDSVTSFSLSCGPTMSNGEVVINDTCLTYTPDSLLFDGTLVTGTDQICISVCNSEGVCDVTNVNLTITGFNVIGNNNATLLAESLAGAGVTITNAVLSNCAPTASGYYTNPPNALGLDDGIILSSGRAIDASGPSAGILSTSYNTTGEPDLQALLTQLGETYNVNDACVLEFDIDVLGDSLTFNYVMGSEEYNNFVCGSVNDIFGFFVTGQNPIGPNYVSQNVALVPGSTTPVSINTVNNGTSAGSSAATCILTNAAFFNGVLPGISYGGNTKKLEAKILTQPCTSYHFKLAIGDGGDWIYDSGVFLESGSFNSLPVTLASSTVLGDGFTNAVEGCVDGLFSFELNSPLTTDYGIKFQIGGTAINGVDYNLIQDSITFFAGTTSVNVNIVPITDAITEGDETVKLYLLNPCTNLPFDSAELTIIDLIPFNLTTVPDSLCPGDTAVLHATIAGDDNNLAIYNWTPNNGAILDIDSGYTLVVPNATQDYYIEYTLGSCTQMDTTSIFVSTFSMSYDTNMISCPGANDGGFTALPSNAIGNVTYEWLPSLSTDSFIVGLGPDTVFITSTDQFGLSCGTITDTLFLVEPVGLNFNYDTVNVSCNGLDDGILNITSLAPNTTYEVNVVYMGSPLPPQSFITDANGDFSLTNLPPGLYDSILITNSASGCFNTLTFNIDEPDSLFAEIFTPGVVLCSGGTIDSLSVNVVGGTTPYSYLWSTSASTATITGVGVGSYWVLVTDSNGCQASDTFVIAQPNPLAFTLLADSVNCFGGSNGLAYIDTLGGGTAPYTFLWDAAAGSQANDTAFNLAAGTYSLTVTDFNGCQEQQSITVEEPLELQVTETHTDVSCFGNSDGSIDVSIAGGILPYTYSWTGPNGFVASTEDLSGLQAGSYSLDVSDSLSCVNNILVVIGSPTALVLVMDSTAVTCNGLNNGAASVTVSGGTAPYSYIWNDPLSQTTNPATGLGAGSYQVIVTDANTCADSAQVIISEPDSLLMTIDNVVNVLCNGAATGAISVSTTGGTPAYTYLWSNGGGSNEDLTNATAGNYTLTVTDANACTYQVTQVITEPPALAVGLVGTNVACFGGLTGAINAAVNGGVGPYTYAWSGPAGFTAATEDIAALAAGDYTLLTTDANNCTNTQTLTITEPATIIITFTSQSVNCFGGNDGSLTANVQSGGVAPFQFQWDAAANNQIGATATGLVAGTYTVTVTDANGCTFNNSATVVEPLTPLSVVTVGTDITCAGYQNGIAIASAQGGTPAYSYLWNDPLGQITSQATDLASNTYQVTVSDANGCVATDTIFIDEPAPINVVPTTDSANCWGAATGAINVFADGGTGVGYAYSIDGGESFQNSPDFLNLPAGVYDQIVVQDLGSNDLCLSSLYTTTVFEQPYFSFEVLPADTTLQLEESVDLSLVVSSPNYTDSSIVLVAWYPTIGLNCSDCVDPTVLTYEHYTEYVATVSYEGGDGELCTAISNSVIIVENNLELFIPNAFTPGSFDDMNNVFEVFGEGIEYVTMQVYNRWGEKIFESSNQRVAWDGTFKGEMQSPGVYSFYVKVEYLDGKIIDRKGSITLIR